MENANDDANEVFLNWWYGTELINPLTAIGKDGGSPIRCRDLAHAMELNKSGHNIYLTANPLPVGFEKPKATEEDVAMISTVALDMDPPECLTVDDACRYWKSAIERLTKVDDILVVRDNRALKPSVAFHTGRCGLLAYRLSSPLDNTEENRERIKALHRKLALVLGADQGGDVAHLYKAPLTGTTAWMKSSKAAAGWPDSELGEVYWRDGPTYLVEQLEAMVSHVPDEPTPDRNSNETGWFRTIAPDDQAECAASMLETLNPDEDYHRWVAIGMALASTGADLFGEWDEWSKTGKSYQPGETAYKWRSFKKEGVTMGTLIYAAKEAGWDREKWLKDRADRYAEDLKANADDPDADTIKSAMQVAGHLPEVYRRMFVNSTKKASGNVINLSSIAAVMKEVAASLKAEDGEEEVEDLTHDDMALAYQDDKGDQNLVYDLGELWAFNPTTNLWERHSKEAKQALGQRFKGQALARRASDIKGIMERLEINCAVDGFFSEAVAGLATPSAFYRVGPEGVVCENLTREHRARYQIKVEPECGQMPLLMEVLKFSIGDYYFKDQCTQLFEGLGLAAIGELHKLQRVLLIVGESNNFKSQLFKLVGSLFSKEARTAVRLTDFHIDTKVIKMMGAAINIAPEVTEDNPIHGDTFKSITGGDEVSGNSKYKDTVFDTITASQLTAGQFFPTCTEYTKAFFNRWLIHKFPNGKEDDEVDPTLYSRIEAEELPQIVYWLLQGAQGYFARGQKPYLSPAHHECLAEWKQIRDSVSAFVYTTKCLVPREPYSRDSAPVAASDAFTEYQRWCVIEGRKALGRTKFYERMDKIPNAMPGSNQNGKTYNGFSLAREQNNQA